MDGSSGECRGDPGAIGRRPIVAMWPPPRATAWHGVHRSKSRDVAATHDHVGSPLLLLVFASPRESDSSGAIFPAGHGVDRPVSSPPLEHRLALLGEGLHALLGIVGDQG